MPEEEAFAVFVKIMQDYGMRRLFTPTMSSLNLCFYLLEALIQVHCKHDFDLVYVRRHVMVFLGVTSRSIYTLSGSRIFYFHVVIVLVSYYVCNYTATLHRV